MKWNKAEKQKFYMFILILLMTENFCIDTCAKEIGFYRCLQYKKLCTKTYSKVRLYVNKQFNH